MLRVVGAREAREGLFFCRPGHIDPVFLRRAYEFERLYERWKLQILFQVDHHVGPISMKDLAKIFNTYPMKLTRVRHLGVLSPDDTPSWRFATASDVTSDDVRNLFDANESFLEQSQGHGYGRSANRRAPLSSIFLNWLEKRHPDFLRKADPELVLRTAI
jgi:hypothetical protein